MKPSITIDERGVILHVTNAAGEGVAVALNKETLGELVAQGTIALEALQSPGTRGTLFWNIGRAVVRELLKHPTPERDGTPPPDPTREKDRP